MRNIYGLREGTYKHFMSITTFTNLFKVPASFASVSRTAENRALLQAQRIPARV